MLIQSPDPITRIVEDYEFRFANGQSLATRIDTEAGDTIDTTTHPLVIMLHFAAKPSANNPKVIIPKEDLTIFLSHVLSITKVEKEIVPLTTEQQMAWMKTVQEIGKTVQ